VAFSAIAAKELGHRPFPLAALADAPQAAQKEPPPAPVVQERDASAQVEPAPAVDPAIRWFNARPVRPARTMWMEVTAYSPDARSCGKFADGLTATLHSVHTNAHALVAADPRILPLGSIVSVPGYDEERIVPVLDVGSAIKGYRLDVLFPTHKQARQWGRQWVPVTIWEYADGLPPDNPRALR
jgi:3D (Asp-Asp-Asp) domain-containing protein